MAVDKSLISGSTTLLILSLLEEKGWLTVYEQETGGKMRKYYRITRDGKKQYQAKKKEWKEYSEAILQVIGDVCFGTA